MIYFNYRIFLTVYTTHFVKHTHVCDWIRCFFSDQVFPNQIFSDRYRYHDNLTITKIKLILYNVIIIHLTL